jgi:BirA family transcriptional regulator, biotin operon repressor / biotin---[acetyl-CoA-carboxylase] ligase
VALINNVIIERFIELLRVDSTNNYAMQQVQSGTAMHGDAYFAFEQTAGRGQMEKQWSSASGENIILSVILNTSTLQLQQQFALNMIAALCVIELFNNYTTEKFKIKWPNDVYWRDRKAAGILIENVIRGKSWQFAVVGFGVNINQMHFADTIKNPTSLKQITGADYDVVLMAKELSMLLQKNFRQLDKPDYVLNNYNALLYKKDEMVSFRQNGATFTGIVKNVTKDGKLVLVREGKEKTFITGELEWII